MKRSALAFVVAYGAAGCATAPHGVPNLHVVEPGLLRGGEPTADGWRYLRQQGVCVDVQLDYDDERPPGVVPPGDIDVRRFSMPPNDLDDVELADLRERARPPKPQDDGRTHLVGDDWFRAEIDRLRADIGRLTGERDALRAWPPPERPPCPHGRPGLCFDCPPQTKRDPSEDMFSSLVKNVEELIGERDALNVRIAELEAERAKSHEAAIRAIVELDSITCGPSAPCEAPVERAVSLLLPIADPDGDEDWTAAKALAAIDDKVRG